MIGDAPDIQWIVAEVMRRLARLTERPDAATFGAPSGVPAVPAASAATAKPDEWIVKGSLITLETLQGQLDQVRCIVVRPRTVITPAVKDELRKRGIELAVRASGAPDQSDSQGLMVWCCSRTAEARRLATALTELVGLVGKDDPDLRAAVRHVAARVAGPRQVAILLTDQPLAAACMANRLPAIRAAAGLTGKQAREAIARIGANVLVVDPRQVSGLEWKQIVHHFGSSTARDCPALLK